ncbi:MAG: Holliday junction branch migration protein RuvA [Gammaproteobacteria bacterium]|nr:Holliday junction branch migration protein RuvA [Gammaproteobacteria bacterium]
MIDRLTGALVEKQASHLVVDCHGVGYLVEVPLTVLGDLPPLGETVTLLTHFVVREDAQLLYGFIRHEDRTLFRTLLKVNGVGAKIALAVLSGMNASEFAWAVQHDDISTLVKLPGVGNKLAERLIVEMRDKVGGLSTSPGIAPTKGVKISGNTVPTNTKSEAVAGLEVLGYKGTDAVKLVDAVYQESLTSSELIKLALRSTVR